MSIEKRKYKPSKKGVGVKRQNPAGSGQEVAGSSQKPEVRYLCFANFEIRNSQFEILLHAPYSMLDALRQAPYPVGAAF